MRGQILSFDDGSGAGLISGDDGIRYSFGREAVTPPSAIVSGLRVDFIPVAGEATNVMLLAAAPAAGAPSATPGVPIDGFDFQKVFLSFNGRTRRSHFWIAWISLLVGGFIIGLIPILGFFIGLALIWPGLAIQVTRLHDMGKSGWLVLIPVLTNIVGFCFIVATVGVSMMANMEGLENEDPAVIMATFGPAFGIGVVIFLIQLAFLLWIGVTDSQRGENRFGPNPKGEY
ncbi:MAG: DUF805 domain-containing protein [Pseudomonadota bacterium]